MSPSSTTARWTVLLLLCGLALSCGRRKPKRRSSKPQTAQTARRGIPLQAVATPSTLGVLHRLRSLFSKTGRPIDLRCTATPRPTEALAAGKAGLAILSEPPDEKPKRASGLRAQALLLGAETVALVANATNPIDHLSMQDLRKILRGLASNWRAVRGPRLPLITFTLGESGDLGRLLRKRVTRGKPFDIVVRQVADVPTLLESVRRTPGGLGLVALYQLPKGEAGKLTPRGLKMLALTRALGSPGYLATDRAAAIKGQYPLMLPVTLLSRVPAQHKGAATLGKLLDPTRRRNLAAQLGLLPLSKATHAALAKKWAAFLR